MQPDTAIAVLLAALAVTGCVDRSPAASDTIPAVVTPTGFEREMATVTADDGTTVEVCLWTADDPDDRRRGLMGVTDLGAAEGMAFRFDAPGPRSFWMKDTLIPLSIAAFDAGGAFLAALDMTPCTTTPCPSYPLPDGTMTAVEAELGALPGLGMTEGSTLRFDGEPCP